MLSVLKDTTCVALMPAHMAGSRGHPECRCDSASRKDAVQCAVSGWNADWWADYEHNAREHKIHQIASSLNSFRPEHHEAAHLKASLPISTCHQSVPSCVSGKQVVAVTAVWKHIKSCEIGKGGLTGSTGSLLKPLGSWCCAVCPCVQISFKTCFHEHANPLFVVCYARVYQT